MYNKLQMFNTCILKTVLPISQYLNFKSSNYHIIKKENISIQKNNNLQIHH